MSLFVVKDQFEADGFTYLYRVDPKGKEVFTCAPTDGSMNPRQLSKKEYKAIKQSETLGKNMPENPHTQPVAMRVLLPPGTPEIVRDNKEYVAHIAALCEKHSITAEFYKNGYTGGAAYMNDRRIRIPVITCGVMFCVALHEVAHIVLNAVRSTMPVVEAEYACEMWAMREGLRFDVPLEDLLHYRKEARKYVRTFMVKEAKKKSFDPDKIPINIAQFCEVDPHYMKNAYIVHDLETDEMVVHQKEDCERFRVSEEHEFVTQHQCLGCHRVWITVNPK